MQDRDQLLVNTNQPFSLRPCYAELPEQDGVPGQHRQDDERKSEGQTRTDVQLRKMISPQAGWFRASVSRWCHKSIYLNEILQNVACVSWVVVRV
jgi:hypothetical protein